MVWNSPEFPELLLLSVKAVLGDGVFGNLDVKCDGGDNFAIGGLDILDE